MDYRFSRQYQAQVLKNQGLATAEIAQELGVTPDTARKYVYRTRSAEEWERHRELNRTRKHRVGDDRPRAEYIAEQNANSWWGKGDRIETLKRLWMTDMWVAEMAVTLGTTRNAIIGKAHRLGLPRKK